MIIWKDMYIEEQSSFEKYVYIVKGVILVRYHSGGSMKLNACTVSCFSHTWFIYNLNTLGY